MTYILYDGSSSSSSYIYIYMYIYIYIYNTSTFLVFFFFSVFSRSSVYQLGDGWDAIAFLGIQGIICYSFPGFIGGTPKRYKLIQKIPIN